VVDFYVCCSLLPTGSCLPFLGHPFLVSVPHNRSWKRFLTSYSLPSQCSTYLLFPVVPLPPLFFPRQYSIPSPTIRFLYELSRSRPSLSLPFLFCIVMLVHSHPPFVLLLLSSRHRSLGHKDINCTIDPLLMLLFFSSKMVSSSSTSEGPLFAREQRSLFSDQMTLFPGFPFYGPSMISVFSGDRMSYPCSRFDTLDLTHTFATMASLA